MVRILTPGCSVSLNFTIANTGQITGEKDVELIAEDDTSQTVDQLANVEIDANATSSTLTLTWDIPQDQETGEYSLVVDTGDATDAFDISLVDQQIFRNTDLYGIYELPDIYLTTASGRVVSVDRSGSVNWNVSAANDRILNGAAIDSDSVYVVSDTLELKSLSKTDGSENWSYSFSSTYAMKAYPRVSNGRVFISTRDGRAYAVDKTDGSEIWSYSAGASDLSGNNWSIGENNVFIHYKDEMIGVARSDGTENWRETYTGSIENIVAYQDSLYIAASDTLYSIDTSDGTPIWQTSLSNFPDRNTLSVTDDSIFIRVDGTIYQYDRQSGNEEWSFSANASSVQIVYNGSIYYNTDTTVEKVDIGTTQTEVIVSGGNFPTVTSVDGNNLYTIDTDDVLTKINLRDNSVIYSFVPENDLNRSQRGITTFNGAASPRSNSYIFYENEEVLMPTRGLDPDSI